MPLSINSLVHAKELPTAPGILDHPGWNYYTLERRNYISKETLTTGKSQKEMVIDLCLDLAKNKWSIAGTSGPAKLSKVFIGHKGKFQGSS